MRWHISLTGTAVMLLAVSIPAFSQRVSTTDRGGRETRNIEYYKDYVTELRFREPVHVNKGGDWVEAVGPDGRLIVERSGGGRDQRVEFTRAPDGTVQLSYSINGRMEPLDRATRQWVSGMVLRAVREFGLGSGRRGLDSESHNR